MGYLLVRVCACVVGEITLMDEARLFVLVVVVHVRVINTHVFFA